MAGLNERLLDENAVYDEWTTIPANTSATSARLRTGEGGQLGSTIIQVRANSAITIADTTTITVSVNDNDLATGGTDTNVCTTVYTASGATTFADGAVISEIVLPRTVKEFTSVTVATTDAGAAGTYDAFCSSPMGRTNV